MEQVLQKAFLHFISSRILLSRYKLLVHIACTFDQRLTPQIKGVIFLTNHPTCGRIGERMKEV
jgi:hypothetical protein